MTQPLLSILIPTVVGREDGLNKLINKIADKIGGIRLWQELNDSRFNSAWSLDNNVEVITAKDNKEVTIGEKREILYSLASGLFSWMPDDDDDFQDNAIELILQAIKSNPEVDCITFEEYCNMDGKEYKSNHSIQYSGWYGDGSRLLHDGFHFHRTPFMKDVIRTDIAKSVPIRHVRFGEDNFWADDLHPHLKTEIHIPEQIYRYIHISSPHNLRYGIQDAQD